MVLSALLSSPESWTHKSQPSWKLSDTFRHFFFLFLYSAILREMLDLI